LRVGAQTAFVFLCGWRVRTKVWAGLVDKSLIPVEKRGLFVTGVYALLSVN
jgi:hypothetical protein